MGITGIHAIPMMITCMLQGTLCDTGIPCTFYGENICSVPCLQLQCIYWRYSCKMASVTSACFCKLKTFTFHIVQLKLSNYT